jgi:hypothetical protein
MAHSSNHHRQHYFAPGAIEHHVFSRAHQRRALVRWLKRAGLVIACVLWFLAVFTAVASPAHAQTTAHSLAPTTVGLHLHSVHLGNKKMNWNDANRGAYARWGNGLTLGTLRNSVARQSHYAAWSLERPLTSRLSAGLTLGVISGYDRLVAENPGTVPAGHHTAVRCNAAGLCRTVLLKPVLQPMVVPSVAWAATPRAALRVSFVPKTGADAEHAFHLSAEWRF